VSIIEVENLNKEFQQRIGREGLRGAIKDLFKREYRLLKAVNNSTFSIEPGEIVGYIGPNGAGKSTTIKMLTGILMPTSGKIIVNGRIPFKNREINAQRIGVVFGQRTQLWWDIPVSETLSLMRYIYKVPDNQYKENLKIFSEVLGLGEFIHTPVRQLSLGQRMRADICCALLHNPDILFLDEPTIGLDFVVKEKIREFIREINKTRGTTMILATHDMSDIERLSTRVMIINYGEIMYDGDLNSLRRKFGSEEIITADILSEIEDINELQKLGVSDFQHINNRIIIKYNSDKVNSSTVVGWLMNRTRTNNLSIMEIQIEDIIRRMYQNGSKV
jgi:ABC-2 type transport system ATP-binding protein